MVTTLARKRSNQQLLGWKQEEIITGYTISIDIAKIKRGV
jgi:hypothetical protein